MTSYLPTRDAGGGALSPIELNGFGAKPRPTERVNAQCVTIVGRANGVPNPQPTRRLDVCWSHQLHAGVTLPPTTRGLADCPLPCMGHRNVA